MKKDLEFISDIKCRLHLNIIRCNLAMAEIEFNPDNLSEYYRILSVIKKENLNIKKSLEEVA